MSANKSPATKLTVSLSEIQQAYELIKPNIKRTEIDESLSASRIAGSKVYYKFENEQITGSFKLRGALNKIAHLTEAEKKAGVVASSAGNHAQGVAYSATRSGVKSTIVMPRNAALVKVSATREYGANVILHGDIYDDAYEKARILEKEHGFIFVPPYEDERIIAGQGTIGLELLESIPDLDSIVVPIGGGGLISGIATAVKALNPKCKIFGVQSTQAPGMERLFHHQDQADAKKRISTIADGIAIKKPSQLMYDSFISKLVDDVVTVSDDEISEAIVFLIERAKAVTEGSGAVGVAAVLNQKLKLGAKTCVILSGGNIDLNTISQVVNRGLIRKGRLVELAVVVDDIPGTLSKLTQAIADLGANVLEVNHDRVSQGLNLRETRIEFVLETTGQDHVEQVRDALKKLGARF